VTLTATQQRTVETSLDNLHRFKDSDAEAAAYAIDQLVEGGSPEYYEGGARPEREPADVRLLCISLEARLRRIGIVITDEPEASAPRTWDEA